MTSPTSAQDATAPIRDRGATFLAVAVAAATLLLFVLIPVTMAWNAATDPTVAGDPGLVRFLVAASPVGFLVVGGFLAVRRTRNPIGWLLYAIALSLALASVADEVALRHAAIADLGTLGELATWVSSWSVVPGMALLPFVVLLFPSGSIASAAWRRLAAAAAVVVAILVIASSIRPEIRLEGIDITNPLGIASAAPVLDLLIPALTTALTIFGVLVVAHTIWRFRRSVGAERQQLRWFAASALVLPLMMGVAILAHLVARLLGWSGALLLLDTVVASAFFVGLSSVAVAIGIAVTRYGLYEIDRVISRTVSYGLLVVVLGAVYVTVVVGLGAAVSALTGGEGGDLVVAASVLAVVALFGPVRSRVQRTVDRRFNRSGYDARLAVETFAHRLRDEVDLAAIRRGLVTTAAATVQPASVSVWLADAGEPADAP